MSILLMFCVYSPRMFDFIPLIRCVLVVLESVVQKAVLDFSSLTIPLAFYHPF